MKKIKFLALTLGLGAILATPSCAKESNLTRVGMLKTVDSMNLYLTSIAKSNVSSTYIYLNDGHDGASYEEYAQQIYDKGTKARPNCDIAYFPIETDKEQKGLKKLFELDTNKKFKIVYIDCYDNSGDPTKATGVWVGREGWINNSGTSKKFIAGLAKSAQYRTEHSQYKMTKFDGKDFANFEEMYNFIQEKYDSKQLPEFIFTDKNEDIVNYKNIYEYTAIFAAQNRAFGQPFNDSNVLNRFKQTNTSNKKFITNDKSVELFGKIKDLNKFVEGQDKEISEEGSKIINNICSTFGVTSEDRFSLEEMRYGNYHVTDASKPASMTTAFIWIGVGSGVAVIVITLLIIRRVKTGKKLFDVKKALDADIDPDDPKVIRMKQVGEELKQIRIKLNISIEDASYLMRISPKFLEEAIESGELVVPKNLRKKFIACYNLPNDYFIKAYKTK